MTLCTAVALLRGLPVAGTADLLTGADGARKGGALPQATKLPTIRHAPTRHTPTMTLLLLEALGAGLIFVGIVWWTMFAGRKNGEIQDTEDEDSPK